MPPVKATPLYIRSPLKWAGGKGRVLPELLPLMPQIGPEARYIEPFLGSATVFLNTHYARAFLSDNNPDLIGFFQSVRDNGPGFATEAAALFAGSNTREAFDRLKAEYNACREPFRRALLFFYLNRHGFNGLYRVNSKGLYNVPFGRMSDPTPRFEALENLSARLASVDLRQCDFEEAIASASAGDLVYCDPAYVPLSATANFATYTALRFTMADQQRLAAAAEAARDRGATVLISNHDTAVSRALYAGASRVASFNVARQISQKVETRGDAPELIAIYSPGPTAAGPRRSSATPTRRIAPSTRKTTA